MPANRKTRAILLALATLGAALFAAPAAQAADAHYEGISADGRVAVFSTTDKLVPGDTDNQRDVYVREFEEGVGYVTREVSLGPTGGNDAYPAQFVAIDPAGDKVFFSTRERLTAADKDNAEDIYVRDLTTNKTTLVTAGAKSCESAGCGNANIDAGAVAGGVVDEGKRVFFVSSEQLSPQDKDESPDIYERDLEANEGKGETKLVSVAASSCGSGSCGNGSSPAVFQGASADGSKAIFTTAESLASGDTDAEADLYERDLEANEGTGETKLVSAPGAGPEPCPVANCEVANSAISANGAHVFFETNERISPEDVDSAQDVYDWSGSGTAKLASIGPAGGNGIANARFERSSANGNEVFFATSEQLTGADTDSVDDIYVRTGGTTTELVSEGGSSCSPSCGNGASPALLQWVSGDGSTAVFTTAESLTAEDEDSKADVYARALPGGPTTLVSRPGPTCVDPGCGNGPYDASFAGASSDGSHLFVVTDEALVPPAEGDTTGPGDRDESTDVYDRSGGTTTLVSVGQLNGTGQYSGNGAFDAQLQGVSADGSRAFFVTKEQLTGEDFDSGQDVYERVAGGTVLVSRGNDSELEAALAPPVPVLEATDPESPATSTSPRLLGSEPVEEASIKLYSTPDCSGQPVATGSAGQLEEPGIAVSVGAGSTTTFHATAEAEGFISSCSEGLTYRQSEPETEPESEPESGGGEGGGGGGSTGGHSVTPPQLGPSKPIAQYLAPFARITFGPAFKTRARHPVFRFADSTGQAGTTFVCKLDRHTWQSCSSPTRLKKLGRGRHLFEVKGINAVGVLQAKPTKRRFKLVRHR